MLRGLASGSVRICCHLPAGKLIEPGVVDSISRPAFRTAPYPQTRELAEHGRMRVFGALEPVPGAANRRSRYAAPWISSL